MNKLAIATAAVLAVAGCQKSPGATASAGTERADCRVGSAGATDRCDTGLLCLSELCVRPPPANCQAVAEKLASFEVGNYAPRDQRAKVIADKQAACVAAVVSKDEGDCIARATDRWAAAKCAPSMFPGMASSGNSDCAAVIEKITGAMPANVSGDPQMAAQLGRTMDVMKQSCVEDAWPDDLKRCVLAAPPGQITGMQACNDKMPKALQDKMTARLMDSMQKR